MRRSLFLIVLLLVLVSGSLSGQNPIIRNQFSADPTARIFNGRVYVFPSHDIPAPEGKNLRKDWFCMEDYHLFSSDDLVNWTDHGVIVTQSKVNWVDSTSYSMWAPDCVERNGKYYFYFPANNKLPDANGHKLFSIGVAVADKPEGPYIPQKEPIEKVQGIDPNLFIDKDGQAYLYWSQQEIYVAKLKENMVELETEPLVIAHLPEKGLKEGAFVFERNGIYYLTFPHVEHKIERLEYAISDNPMGPFKMAGVIMDESPLNCWTNHHSLIEFKNQWYLFYHQNEYSPQFDKNRSICIDSLFFNADGTIQKVLPTSRGVGITPATAQIQIDRFSQKSDDSVSITFLDSTDHFKGWKTVLEKSGSWIKYNAVGFEKKIVNRVDICALSPEGGTVQIRLDSPEGPVISEVKVPGGTGWKIIEGKVNGQLSGIRHLVILLNGSPVAIDWIRFRE